MYNYTKSTLLQSPLGLQFIIDYPNLTDLSLAVPDTPEDLGSKTLITSKQSYLNILRTTTEVQ